MSDIVEPPKSVEAPKEPTAEEKRTTDLKARQDAEAAKAKAIRDATEARALLLKANEGKWFKPVKADPKFPNKLVQVIAYGGVKKVFIGELKPETATDVHIYIVESIHPSARWTPPAYQFLLDYEPTDAPAEAASEPQPPL